MSETTGAVAAPAAEAERAPRPRNFYTEPQWLDVRGVRVAYRRKGTGEPTLYLHGAGFTRMWLPVLEELSGSLDLIAPEHPGYGETEMPEWLNGFDDLVLHYDDMLDALELDQVHLVGWSLGGWIAAEFAAFYPDRLKSLTLITPAGLRIPGKPIANPFGMTPEQFMLTIFNDTANMADVLPDPESLEEVVHLWGEGATLARIVWEVQYDLALERRLARVECPALVVRAEHDRLIPDEMAERYAELLPDAHLETIPGTGHAIAIEQPAKTAAAIARFINGEREATR